MRECKNQVLFCEHAVTAGDVFCSYLQRALKKLDDMTPKAFKACFEVLFKLYDNLKADYELTIGEKERHLIFFNAFSSEHQNMFVQQQKEYHKMTMDKIVNFFQICHAKDQPLHEQCQWESAARNEHTEANHERDATNKKCAAAQKKNPLSTNNDRSNNHGCTENLCPH